MATLTAATGEPSPSTLEEAALRILRLENRLQRERLARLHAEAIAEKGLSDLYERQRQLTLLESIATRANQSNSVEETLRFAIEAICGHAGWVLGNVYLVDSGGGLTPNGIWFASDAEFLSAFIDVSLSMRFRNGNGLPGRVLATGQACWITDVTLDENFSRNAQATACGLGAGFAFPVLIGSETVAVLEFFHRERLEFDDQLLHVMSQIGTQLGRVLERKRAEDKLVHDATHDTLTGLPNRLYFTNRLSSAISAQAQQPDLAYAVLFIDLDGFKLVNDSLGHAAGDQLLVEVASRLEVALEFACREQQRSPSATLGRLGGDEFTVLLEHLPDSNSALRIAERVLACLRQPTCIQGQDIYPSASIGIAVGDSNYVSAADIMRDADLAMYRAKTEGRSRIELFFRGLHDRARARLAMESDLRSAISRREFELHYQPIVDLQTLAIAGFEALVRWRRADGTLVPPSEFIGLAEETGLIVLIGHWVMREAFSTLARWQKARVIEKPLTMSVNVSPRQFHQIDFVEQVTEAIRDSGAPASSIRLEITEGVTIQDATQCAAILTSLRALGVGVSLDDFGTGYSSLSYLHKLPFDTLKIDRSFVTPLNRQSEDGSEIVHTILGLARSLRVAVVAEGIETADQADRLLEMGCDYGQGYLFARPLNEAAAATLLEAT